MYHSQMVEVRQNADWKGLEIHHMEQITYCLTLQKYIFVNSWKLAMTETNAVKIKIFSYIFYTSPLSLFICFYLFILI